jgi:transcription-repair coupling factor (superfamily II helicase)
VTYRSAIWKVVTRRDLEKNTFKVSVEDKISIDFINEVLFEYEFKRVDFITEPENFLFVEVLSMYFLFEW